MGKEQIMMRLSFVCVAMSGMKLDLKCDKGSWSGTTV